MPICSKRCRSACSTECNRTARRTSSKRKKQWSESGGQAVATRTGWSALKCGSHNCRYLYRTPLSSEVGSGIVQYDSGISPLNFLCYIPVKFSLIALSPKRSRAGRRLSWRNYGNPPERPSLRFSDDSKIARLRGGCDYHAGAGHWSKHRDLQFRGLRLAEIAAVSASRAHRQRLGEAARI